MKCTECTKPIRPLVAVDIDGTLGDYHRHFANFLELWLGKPSPEEEWDGVGDFEDYFGITKEKYREAKLAYRQGGWKRWMPIDPYASAFISYLRDKAEVWIATSRPWQRLDNIDPDTVEWLRRNGITVDGIIYGDDKYFRLYESIDPFRIVAILDDQPKQCHLASQLGIPAIQKVSRWNRGIIDPGIPATWSLQDALLRIERLLTEWAAHNEA